ncbi:uncharacterized protein LOC110237035 [Exaiptasia diaphana]|uniref:Integrase core domain-containing protein n=1 Tax=Exaiptasia diaphana TaxID=2652724 RepID=A0A913X3B0_EXADI|nr:uncharacterized protein LOC110237035 [Exaiptasia diaphana]KXJ15658.1 hypothetical protein AC249_AIPGENE11061 [Exaiptasia diaphana]
MAERVRNDLWKEDEALKETLERYVKEGLQRKEILDFMVRDFDEYTWSIRTLDRRLAYFEIKYTNRNIALDEIQDAVKKEMDGPGKLLGYRALHKKIRQVHGLNVPRDVVYAVMYDIDANALHERAPQFKRKKVKGHFTSPGPNCVHSLDGHDKLMGYQNWVFPIAVYGCIDTCSRRILWIKVWTTNSDPNIIGRFYLEYLFKTRRIANKLRLDKGTETGIMATMHAYLRQNHGDVEDPVETVIYGPSTSNQIERWWRELHERLEKFFKGPLNKLKDHGIYEPDNDHHRNLIAYIMIPIMQKEIDTFVNTVWNSHRIRHQKDTYLPDGVPNHIYAFPEKYDLQECGFEVTQQQLDEVAELSDVFSSYDDYMPTDVRNKCEQVIADPLQIDVGDFHHAFRYLKEKISL